MLDLSPEFLSWATVQNWYTAPPGWPLDFLCNGWEM